MRPRPLLAALAALAPVVPAVAQSGHALSFGPFQNDEVNVSLAAPAGPFTLEAWVHSFADTSAYGYYTVLEFGDDRPFFGVIGNRLGVTGPDGLVVRAPEALPTGTWQHVAFTFDGAASRLYQNGVEVAAALAAPPSGGAALGIGYGLGDTAWPGYVDEVIVWGRARTAAEVAADMDGLSAAEIASADLLAYFRFDEGTGQTVANERAGGPAGTLGPTPAVEINDPAWVRVTAPTGRPPAGTPAGLRLTAPWPSPARTTVALEVAVAQAGPAHVAVVDVLGREVTVLHDGPLVAGAPLRLTVDAGRLAPGAYVVRLAAGGRALTRPFVVAR